MKRNFSYNLLIATLFCCGFTVNAQNLQDEGVSAMSAPWKTQFKAASVGYVYGDVNGDEKTDISDIVSIINAISQDDGSNPRADVNEDGSIDISDIVKVINIIAGVDTPPITVDRSILDMTTGESEDVRIVRVSGSGDYEVTNENPEIVTVEWLSGSSTASERRKVKAAGDTEIGEGDSFSTDGFLKVYALQPGQAKITVLDKSTSRKLVVSITVTADYNTEIFTDISPNNATYVAGSTVACKFTVTTPSAAELKCRIILSEEPDMSETTQVAEITINGTEGEETVYNENGETTTFSNLKSDTKYYWRILYYDTQSGSYMNGSPINWFKTITLCPDDNHPHVIDMGEAGKWSCCNVGASAPWEYGGYYAWGETEEKENYNWSTYKYCDGSEDSCHYLGEDIAGTDYDVARVKWGEDWKMPSEYQLIMLINNSSSEWITVNGVAGRRLTGSNGGSIFFPAAGERWYDDTDFVGSNGFYWSSTQRRYFPGNACTFDFENQIVYSGMSFLKRSGGVSVRPIISESELEPELADPASLCPDENHPHIIDMGDAGKWSCCNVGASAPWEYGGYYAWGETEEKEYYDWNTYIHCDGSVEACHNLGEDIAGTDYDVAHVKWGDSWRLPSEEQLEILSINCSSAWVSVNGVKGIKITCPNGGSIFLPASGYRWYDHTSYVGSYGYYLSSTQSPNFSSIAFGLGFFNEYVGWDQSDRFYGHAVRPVISESEPEDAAVAAGLCPDENHPHIIDMGDAGKWSCCNVGASAPWEYGGYYAWGETEEKEGYDWSTYIHCDGSEDSCYDLGSNISGTQYDVAHVKWGSKWCMPSNQQIHLLENCSSEWTELNGINGRKFTAPNGGTIFLPAAGGRYRYNDPDDVYSDGSYWSSSQCPSPSYYAYFLQFGSDFTRWYGSYRRIGRSVRPVIDQSEPLDPAVEFGLCPDSNHPHVIDMGEAGKWACCNVGASAPWEYGGYFAWGETEEKESYSWSTYIHCDGSYDTCHDLGEDIAGTEYDVAHVKWGGNWCMPSRIQQDNLIRNCYSEWTSLNGVFGRKYISPDGGAIFLPAAGYTRYEESMSINEDGNYWSSTPYGYVTDKNSQAAFYLNFNNNKNEWHFTARVWGRTVRPVIYESEPDFEPEPEDPANLCPDENHPHIIDMGDAGKWACCNVGASAPWEYGGYYAWGETEEKDNYSVETYIHCNGSIETCHAIGDDIAGTEYDVAHVKWGDTWCLPSIEQIKNLLNHSTSEWRTVNGIKGIKFTATNGKTIFLPAAARYNSDDVGVLGYYWSSMQNPNELYYAYSLNFNPTDSYWSNSNTRNYGFSVRPVTE